MTKNDLSVNQFSDGIPKEIGELQNPAQLSLRHKKLHGSIQDSMRNMYIVIRKRVRDPPQAESLSTVTRERISNYELLQATDGLSESNLIGFGSFGSVYKGILISGTAIAVKVFNLQLNSAFKSLIWTVNFCTAFAIGIL
ncbi:hypothetical protein CQW23_09475 [Capsicum baccatum]|uniref:Protein kinase domain-containing protein n=1 Tax=Capsicum baccatum TaxID=33114 RepID=A0A2G2WWV9_CAPBA|nr:hypothetical protein CQW23_09475 [Capsicum baccatum]